MRIGFDGTLLGAGKTGIGYYTQFLIRTLAAQHADLTLTAYDGLRQRPALPMANAEHNVPASGSGGGAGIADMLRRFTFARRLYRGAKALNFRALAGKIDLYHATNYLPPAPMPGNRPFVPLIHDVSHIRHPQWHPSERVAWLESRHGEFQSAPIINTVSQFSAAEITATLDIGPQRIRVTYPGINPLYLETPAADVADHVLQRFDVTAGRFFVCVGALEPRKNLKTAIAGYAQVSPDVRAHAPLLIIGPSGWGDLDMPADFNALERAGHIRFCGYAPEVDMHVLYREAAALLFPSAYEGFGMPVAEAMATGTQPVIAPDGAPAEVAGPHARTAAADDPAQWAEAMAMALDENWHGNGAHRARLSAYAVDRFNWTSNAQQTYAMYREAMKAWGVQP